jgi:signal transduction histidine kinase
VPLVSDPITEATTLVVVLTCLAAFVGTPAARRLLGWRTRSDPDPSRPAHRSDASDRSELRRIRWLIHDHTVQRLIALGWWAERTLGDDGAAMATETRDIVEELRSGVLATGARPGRMDLVEALRALLDGERGRGVPSLHLLLTDDTGGHPDGMPVEVTAVAYDVVREALSNAVRHSSATVVAVDAFLGPGLLHVEVIDDGVGIDRDARRDAADRGHAGLCAMAGRASEVGARLEIVTSGRGTRVALDWRR